MNIKIEILSNDYIDLLVNFKLEQQREMHKNMTDEELRKIKEAERVFLEKHLNEDLEIYGLFEEDKLLAVSGMQIFETSPGAISLNGLTGYICNVYTLPEFRKQGFQHQLLEYCIKVAQEKQIKIMFLGTSNPIAANFYKKHDFKVNEMVLVRIN